MKAFRGTALALIVLALLVLGAWAIKPELFASAPTKKEDDAPRLFEFEKPELVRVDVHRPDGVELSLAEENGEWTIVGTGFPAGRSMVNRVKHQIHDLTARATVVDNPENPELYGLGKNAIQVKLTLRDGKIIEFLAGDPNPTAVSYYLQRKDDGVVYTVKKSAVDYYSLTLEEFRERRFASFDSKDATSIKAELTGKPTLMLERQGDDSWTMKSPEDMRANTDRCKRLLGRISALKADSFLEGKDPKDYGLDHPRARIEIGFANQEPLALLVGNDAPSDNKFDEFAYVQLEGDPTIYVAKRGLLEEYGEDPTELRNRQVVEMKEDDVVAVDAWLKAGADDELHGEAGVRYAAEQWVWKDGVPVPGSTPSRVAKRVAEMEAVEFVADAPKDLGKYGLVEPRVKVVLTDTTGAEKVVLLGTTGPPETGPEGQERARYYASIEGQPGVYLVDEGVLSVVQDMIREWNRKADKDADKAMRRERIETVADKPDDGDHTDPE